MNDKPINQQWCALIDRMIARLKAQATSPHFRGMVGMEIHSHDGVIRDVKKTEDSHEKLTA